MAVKTSWSSGDVLTAADLTDTFAAKADLDGATYTGTHDFSGATVSGIGSGLVPIAPATIANSGGSASTTGNITTFTGVSSISLNGIFSATYPHYRILVNSYGSVNDTMRIRLRASGSDITGASYLHALVGVDAGGTAANATASGQTSWALANTDTNNKSHAMSLDIYDAFENTHKLVTAVIGGRTPTGARRGLAGILSYVANSTPDGITIYPASGNITGTVTVYGYQG